MTYEELKEYALQYKNAMLEAGYINRETVSEGYYEYSEKGNNKTTDIAGKHWRGAIRARYDDPDNIIDIWSPWSIDNPTGGWTWYRLTDDPLSIPHLAEVITFLVNAYELNVSASGDDYIELDDLVL